MNRMYCPHEGNSKANQTLKLPVTDSITIFIFNSYVEQKLDEKNHLPILQSHTSHSFFNPILQVVFMLNTSNEIINSIIMNILQPFAHAPANSH